MKKEGLPVHDAVMDKNFYWLNDFKIPNGVHVYGRRYNPFGPKNYPFEIQKTRQFTEIRDRAIWAAGIGQGTRLFFDDEAPGDSRLSAGWSLWVTQNQYFPAANLFSDQAKETHRSWWIIFATPTK